MILPNLKNNKGFTLIELLVVIAIIGVIAGVILVATNGARSRARDTRRKAELSQMARFLLASACYIPNAGNGDYDLADLVSELQTKYPQFAQYSNYLPIDPQSGSSTQTNYHYLVSGSNQCVLYANLENENEKITLSTISTPTAGRGTGVLQATLIGPNGSDIFYQIGK